MPRIGQAGVSRRTLLLSLAAGLPLHGSQHGVSHSATRRARYTCRMFPAPGQPAMDGVRLEVLTAGPTTGSCGDVIVLHEITGPSDLFFAYVDTLVEEGFTVHCPVFFGRPFETPSRLRRAILAFQGCGVFSEFECFKRSAHTPINPWLVALAVDISGVERRKLGAIGMCLTGIQPLAMLRCRGVVAPVLCQPTLPIGQDLASARDFGLPPSDLDLAYARVHAEAMNVLLIRYQADKTSSALRAERLVELFRPRIEFVELTGSKHSSLVHDPDPGGVARGAVVKFLKANLEKQQ